MDFHVSSPLAHALKHAVKNFLHGALASVIATYGVGR